MEWLWQQCQLCCRLIQGGTVVPPQCSRTLLTSPRTQEPVRVSSEQEGAADRNQTGQLCQHLSDCVHAHTSSVEQLCTSMHRLMSENDEIDRGNSASLHTSHHFPYLWTLPACRVRNETHRSRKPLARSALSTTAGSLANRVVVLAMSGSRNCTPPHPQ